MTQRPTLLVVDDEPEVLKSVHDLLRREFRVLTYETGAEAIRALETVDVPVVLADQRMPGMTGVDVLREVRRIRPDATRLLFTGYADINAVIDAINEGNVFRYIAKPFDAAEMTAVIRQAVGQHELIADRRRLVAELEERNQRLVESDVLKRSFIQVASHELNTPVAVVLGLSELWKMAQGPAATEAERAWVGRIQASARRLAQIVERMLKLLRSDKLGPTLDREDVDLGPLLRRVVDDVEPFLGSRGQAVDFEIAPDLGRARVDPRKIGDALTNLVVNAIKFTPDGGRIRLLAHPLDDDRTRVRIVVIDHGSGVAKEDVRHLFQPFFTGFDTLHHSSGDHQFGKKGIGLGLWLVRTFVEMHGGAVEFSTSPGVGSSFGFILPRGELQGVDAGG